MKKVLIIGSRHSGNKNDPSAIAQGIGSEDATASLVYWEDLTFSIETGNVQALIDGNDILADKPDLVIAVGWYKNGKQAVYRDVAYSFALLLQHKGISFWNSEMVYQRSATKLSTMVLLALEGIAVPRTFFSLNFSNVETIIERPFIAKAVSASRGNLNFLVDSDEKLAQVIASDAHFIIQDFLPNDHDLRVICFNGEPALVLRRARLADADTHMNNTSQGGSAQWIELADIDQRILTLCSKISKITHREMAGIDLIPDVSSSLGYSCLEVNAVPQLTSGTDSDKKLVAFAHAIRKL